MSVLGFIRRFVALAIEFVTQRKKVPVKRGNRDDTQHVQFPRSWSTRAEREWQEMDHMFRNNRRHLGGRTRLQRMGIPYHWQTPPKYQLYQHEEAIMQRTSRRRVMVVSNPDPTDDSDGEFEMKYRM